MKNLKHAILAAAIAPFMSMPAMAQDFSMDFERGSAGWRTVVDGVMGGLSTGRVATVEDGVLRFSGNLRLENNGGFSQLRTAVDGQRFSGADGVEVEVRGDGRTYKFDIRLSNVRMMAGAYQQDFITKDGQWTTIRLPFDEFRLYSFGRAVPGAPDLTPANIESIGFTLSDKQPGSFELDVRAIRSYSAGSQASSEGERSDVASVARSAGLTTLLELVSVAGIELPSEPVTILAPTNDAFAALPKERVAALLMPENRDTLRSILAYHVVPGALSSADVLSRRSVRTLNGQSVPIDLEGRATVGNAALLAADVAFDGGVVHVIDAVLLPETRPISEIASATAALSTLVTAVSTAGLVEQLGPENGPWTVFAPVNSAFESLPDGVLEALLEPENRQTLIAVLGLHVVPGRLEASDLLAARRSNTLLGEAIEFSIDGGKLRVGEANIIASDIQAGNGVVHLIDAVLLPRQSEEKQPSSMPANERAARILARAIDRGAPLFNAGQHAGCASVYELTARTLVAFGRDELDGRVIARLERGIAEADAQPDWVEKAWAYRRAFDDALPMLLEEPMMRSRAALTTSTR